MFREDFPMLNKDIIYLDNGATTFKPKSVIDKTADYYLNYSANAHRGDYDIAYITDDAINETRKNTADFINANVDEIIFTSGTTDSINLVVNGFFANLLEENDEVLITYAEHASNVLPWYRLCKKNNIKINYIPLTTDNKVTLENVIKSITPNTKVISLAHITNVLGDTRPIKEITKYAHEHNIFVLVDGAQSVGHIKTDVKSLDIDFLAFSAHKMLGPTGVGVLYGKKELLEAIDPVNLGGGMNESFDDENQVYLKELPIRLEAGTINIAGIIAFNEAIKYLSNIGMDKISEYETNLKNYLINELKSIPHITIYNEPDAGIISFNVDDIFAQDVAVYLNKYNICVRAGNHCAKILKHHLNVKNTVRVSLYFYNTKEEIDKLVLLLKDKNKIISEMI